MAWATPAPPGASCDAPRRAGATLDYVEINPGEARFIFINPNDPSHKPPKPMS